MTFLGIHIGRKPNAARDLALQGVEKRGERSKAVARQIRAELGLPPHPALEVRHA